MLSVAVVEQPRSTDFVTLARVKEVVGIPADDLGSDTRLRDLIADVSGAIVTYCQREFARARVMQSLAGNGGRRLMLERTPVFRVEDITCTGELLLASGYSIQDPEAGFLFREDLWTNSYPYTSWLGPLEPWRQAPVLNHDVAYVGGYLMPNDDVAPASGLASAVAADQSFNISTDDEAYFPLLLPGEHVTVTGFASTNNNGKFTVTSRTPRKITVSASGLTDEVGGAAVAFSVLVPGNGVLPRDLQRIALQEIRMQWLWETGSQRDPTKKSEAIGDWNASWDVSNFTDRTSSLSKATENALMRWVRVV